MSVSSNEDDYLSSLRKILPQECGKVPFLRPKIFGGDETILKEHLWVVAIMYKVEKKTSLENKCVGSIISDRFVITAGHCNMNDGESTADSVRIGEWKFDNSPDCSLDEITEEMECNPKEVDIKINRWLMHPEYKKSSRNKHNDIALIRLAKKINFDEVLAAAICLPLETHLLSGSFSSETIFEVVGWGMIICTSLFTHKYL